jgi:hypothetical protein
MYLANYLIAGIQFRMEMDTWIPWIAKSHFRSFVNDGAEPDVILRFACIYPNTLVQPPIDPQVFQRFSHSIGFNQETILSPLLHSEAVCSRLNSLMDHPEKVGLAISQSVAIIIDFDQHELDIFFGCTEDDDYSNRRLGSALYAPLLVAFSAVMVHSAGLICGDRAALFMAPDEGGKTTVVNQAPTEGCSILSDDQVILRQMDGVLMAHGTPWGLVTDGPKYARLGALFLLEQAEHFELSPLKVIDALEYLWNEHQGYWVLLPKALRLQAFDFINSICHQIPTYRMCFPKDYVDWNAINKIMAS